MQKKFTIKLTKPIVGKRFGVFQHIMKWSGSEKVDIRKYSAGDSASQINRKASAKYQELYTNIFQQEKSLNLDMFLDINYNRRGGEYPNRKQVLAYADDIVSYCQHEQIGMRFFWPEQKWFGSAKLIEKTMPRNTHEVKIILYELLTKVKKTKKIYESSLLPFLNKSVSKTSRRVIVIFSDFLTMDEETTKIINYLKKQHIVFLFQLPIDPEQWQNYSKFFMKEKNITPKWSGEIELL